MDLVARMIGGKLGRTMKVKIEGRGKEREDEEKCLMLEAGKMWVGRQNFSMVFIVWKVLSIHDAI